MQHEKRDYYYKILQIKSAYKEKQGQNWKPTV